MVIRRWTLTAGAAIACVLVPGWNVKVKTTKLAKPITTDEGDKLTEQVSQMTWSGGKIAPGEFLDFPVSLQMPDKAGTALTFKAIQTYSDGTVVRWIEPIVKGTPAPEHPTPILKLTKKSG